MSSPDVLRSVLTCRALFIFVNGPSSGLNCYTGLIGSKLLNCETLTIVKYKSIEWDFPDMNPRDLSKDQRYVYAIAKAIRSGECSVELASRKPGPINQVRWITIANRILRWYMSIKRPTKKMEVIVKFLLTVCIPLWFIIRRNKSIAMVAIISSKPSSGQGIFL